MELRKMWLYAKKQIKANVGEGYTLSYWTGVVYGIEYAAKCAGINLEAE